ncbi:uncharacterized protein OCT59_009081 [Rhizophagus irregularis]|uniref:Uncharacterized protein n=2 Tax=Rhizophagus irregularis TaxID=588596 RepID=U9T9W7_RHIID|nr:hypothetical protein GLOIN_2v1479102 [Rhizophagus irregularis DAOM 181602=DAOM 197198]EXX75666.1 hypothetical protein RirG_039820 [Rhizophagus irregularis DAOM 197198w]POG70573.1 hypothetical protein GLOIN_2v1479102 [Rhizophagus irregularis DAOM 181602=DAOM 197198]UZO17740.1 hypothetical protein OCT59_009081 [Rhizophagus irregularis]GBC24421.1 hypothetical protein GLOIN_2v1479102 [Rhizophagus irregularis DAOM 181602=DAOM 197198]|eukprot:XP_025177439.1 hypothetical protein GLOIN_2v1479102 [Rhizophagus irregularis DAOM 181602=DAOM 197198]
MEEDMGKGLQMKDQDEIIGKNGIFTKLRRRTTNDGAHASSEDEQFEDAPQSPKLSAVSTVPRSKEELENFDKLNNTFSERINQLNVNESTKGPSDDKALELENDNLNENKKHVVTSQGSRDDSECA